MMLCVLWDQEGIIYYELLKPGETVNATTTNWSNCTVFCVKKGCIIGKDMTSWFSSTTSHHRTRQQWSKTTWRHSTGKCLLIRPGFWLSPVFVDGPRAHWTAFRFLRRRLKMMLDEWFASKDEEFFWRDIHKLPERWEKYIARASTLNKFVFAS